MSSHALPLPPDDLPDYSTLLAAAFRSLTQESVDELKAILEEDTGQTFSNEEAWESAHNLLRYGVVLLEASIDQDRKSAGLPPRIRGVVPSMVALEPSPPPDPRPCPIPLDGDHVYEVQSNLRMLEYELSRVKTHPSSWRWAVVAAYNALGHCLVQRRRIAPRDPLHHLMELFDAMTEKVPEIKVHRGAVRTLEVLRTRWVLFGVGRWPVPNADLPGIVRECQEVIRRLEPGADRSSWISPRRGE